MACAIANGTLIAMINNPAVTDAGPTGFTKTHEPSLDKQPIELTDTYPPKKMASVENLPIVTTS